LKLHLANLSNQKLFTGYGDDCVMVNRQRFTGGIVVHADTVYEDWNCAQFDALSQSHFDFFISLQPDVVLVGTGAQQRFAHPRLYRTLTDAGIAVEFMDTPAACRTYNILVAEDRQVLAAIFV
jgi:uncharacterized protein